MTHETAVEPIKHTVTVPIPPDRAFELFVDELATWWPAEYTWAGDALETIAIEPEEGGRCFERGPHGFECDWGRVITWNSPHRLGFTWQVSPARVPEPNPNKASDVDVRFVDETPSTTRVELEHRGFERHGEGGAGYRTGMASPQGWPYILDRYVAAAKSLHQGP